MATPIPTNEAAFTLGEVRRVCGALPNAAALSLGDSASFCGVGTDTRAGLQRKLFVALSGERFDAHDYLSEAFAAGATCALVERDVETTLPTLRVDSTLDALGALGHAHRARWGKRVVAVAGSAGKTTTRSLTAALLLRLRGGRVHFPLGNLNNRVGVPMVLFGLQSEHELLVVEIGTNRTGEVEALAKICVPSVGILTLIDLEHTEGLGGLDSIEAEEGALLRYTKDVAIGNGDDERVRRQILAASVPHKVLYGYAENNDYCVRGATLERSSEGFLMRVQLHRPDRSELWFRTPFLGKPGVLASVAAVATAEALSGAWLSPEQVEPAFAEPDARQGGRLQPLVLRDGTVVIDDSYNANPSSVLAGLEFAAELAALQGARLHAVLGEMRELGSMAEAEHKKIGEALNRFPLASLIAVSGAARHFVSPGVPNSYFVGNSDQALQTLRSELRPGDVVLVKASRGVGAERVVHGLSGGTQ
ncbi:MAG: hypothetical protein RJA70_2112 [Pseudomonadota bacterium]|jgi:UDP-N-acetylmuramoyl-tripeptide--D-alanyl-D-alanine ligase